MGGPKKQTPEQIAAFEKHCKPRQWKKGQSGNPSGRHPNTFRKELNQILKEVGAEKIRDSRFDGKVFKTRLEVLVRMAYKEAQKGSFQYWNAIMERIGGKPIARHEITGPDAGPIVIVRPGDGGDEDTADGDSSAPEAG